MDRAPYSEEMEIYIINCPLVRNCLNAPNFGGGGGGGGGLGILVTDMSK